MRRMLRACAVAATTGAALLAVAAGDGSVIATQPVTVVQIATGSGSGTATLSNTTSGGYSVAIAPDVSCVPGVTFMVAGGNPFTLAALGSKAVQFACPANQPPGLERCLLHARDGSTNNPLVDFLGVCEYATQPTLQPSSSGLGFGSVAIGNTAILPLSLTNNGTTAIGKLFLQTTDLDGNFELSAPCNPDAVWCDAPISALAAGASTTVSVKCTPQSTGVHSAQLLIATDAAQVLSQTVTLDCTGTAAGGPVLGIDPITVEVAAPVEIVSDTATTTLHLTNLGTGTLMVTDLRAVDVDTGAAPDWAFTMSGTCTGVPCSITTGAQVALDLTFDPSTIGTRRASLLVSYHDTLDRTLSIPLDGTGRGATLELADPIATLDFGAVPVNHSSQIDLQLTNHGNRDTIAMLALMPSGAPFTISPATMATVTPTAAKTISITCAPTTAGTFTTMVTAESADASSSTPITIMVTCEGTTSQLYASPTSLVLGELRVGNTTHATLDMLSTGAPLTLDPAQLDTVTTQIMLGSASSPTTPSSIDVAIDPQTPGDLTNHVTISDSTDSVKVPVSGRIVTARYEAPTSVDIGTFCVNQPTTSSNITLTSTGTATLALQAPAFAGSASPFSLSLTAPTMYPTTLRPGTTATTAVTPARQSAATKLSDTLVWRTDLDDANIAITATFIDSGGAIAPPALDFGKVPVHLFLDDGQRVMIQNCNGTLLELDPPSIQPPFSIDSPNFPAKLDPNETATFSVGFHPTQRGTFQDVLAITSPQLPGVQLQVQLVGSTPDAPPEPDAAIPPATPGHTSFYACSCTSTQPAGGAPIVLALALAIGRRRRGSSSAR